MVERKIRFFLLFFLFISLFVKNGAVFECDPQFSSKSKIIKSLSSLPLYFVENRGQSNSEAKYLVKVPKGNVLFTPEEIVYQFFHTEGKGEKRGLELTLEGVSSKGLKARNICLRFLGANKNAVLEGLDKSETRINYFLGNNPHKWMRGALTYHRICYRELYPHVDLMVYGDNGNMKQEWRVRAGGKVEDIRLIYQGIKSLRVNERGQLEVSTGEGKLVEDKPFAYQEVDGEKVEVEVGFLIEEDQTVRFRIGSYRRDQWLIIDPDLIYSTYIGGSIEDQGYGIALDGEGNAYVVGHTRSSDFFATDGAYDTSFNGYQDVVVVKIHPSGRDFLYATFLGGTNQEWCYGIAVDGNGNAYLAGTTFSNDFPTTPGAYDTSHNSMADVFVAKLDSTGANLVYSTFLGGSLNDNSQEIAIDGEGNTYVIGSTYSSDFPVTSGAYDSTPQFGWDAFTAKLNSTGSSLVYSTYLGGSLSDYGRGIDVDGDGNAYVTGWTFSNDFPTTPGAYDTSYNVNEDVFVTKLNSSGSDLLYSTYLGGSWIDRGYGIAVDSNGNAYVTGFTESSDFPATLDAHDETFNGEEDVFVTKLNPSGTSLLFSTYLGGSFDDNGHKIAVDSGGNAYVAGFTESSDFPTTADAYDRDFNGFKDVFITKLMPSGMSLRYSTFLGGSAWEAAWKIATDGKGSAFITGYTSSSDFPTSSSAFDPGYNGITDAFATRIRTVDILPPLNFRGEKIENRSVLQVEYIVELTWEANPDNENINKYRIYLTESESTRLLAEVDAATFQYWHRKVQKNRIYHYDLVAVDNDDQEGEVASVSVQ